MTPTNDSKITQSQTEITCRRDQGAFNPHHGHRHQELLELVQDSAQSIEELRDGFAFRFPSDGHQILTLAEFITLERQCCPFLNFQFEIEADNGPMWLRLTGGEGVKEFLQHELC